MNSTLQIVLTLLDEASAQMAGIGSSVTANLQDIQSQANQVRNTFGLMGAAILGGLGVLVDQAANVDTAQSQLNTAVTAGVDAANQGASATSALAKEKANLQEQLSGVNAKLADYAAKMDTAKGQTGEYDASVATLQTKQQGLKDQLDAVNASLSLVGASTDQIDEQFKNAAISNTNLGFSIVDSTASFRNLFAATDSVTETMKANQEAMDLARAKNLDLGTASTMLIQVMEGNSRALKQFGINLKDGLSPAEALDELQTKLANSAKDYVNTPWGQLDVAQEKTQELGAALGQQLIPTLTDFLKIIDPVIQKIIDWTQAHPELTKYILLAVAAVGLLFVAIAGLATAVGAIAGIMLAAGPVIAVVGAIIAALAGPIGIIVLIVLGLGLIIHNFAGIISDEWGNITNWTNDLVNMFKTAVTNIEGFFDGLLAKVTAVINGIKATVNAVGGAIGAVGNAVGSAVSSVIPKFASGGIVNSPTLALIGEAGPEAVVPLSAFNGQGLGGGMSGGSGGGNIIINLAGAQISDASTAMSYGNLIAKAIQQQLKLRNYA